MNVNTKHVGIVGAGAIAHGLAAFLVSNGHKPSLWSPSGRRLEKTITVNGPFDESLNINVAYTAEELVLNNEIIIFALPLNGHSNTMQSIAPYISEGQHIIISSHASFSALYLKQLLDKMEVTAPISIWNTTAVTAKMFTPDTLNVPLIRKKINMYTAPKEHTPEAMDICKQLFTNEFIQASSMIEVILSNLNPEIHMGMALCNITRMEQAEEWCQKKNVTPSVGRLIESLDKERIAVANAFKVSTKTVFDHYNVNNDVNISSIYQKLHAEKPTYGPKTIESRYILEDVPYGLCVISKLGDYIGIPTPIHKSGIHLFSALCGINFSEKNEILTALHLEKLPLEVITQ